MNRLYYKLDICAFWPARKQSREACVLSISEHLQRLAKRHPLYAQWYRKGYSVAQAVRFLVEPTNISAIERHVMAKRLTSDEPDMCHMGGAWNGDQTSADGCSASWHVGGNSVWVSNSVQITVPETLISKEGRACVVACLRDVVEIWNPAWAGVYHGMWEVEQKMPLPGSAPVKNMIPVIGWMTFVRTGGRRVSVPAPSRCEACGDDGVLITTADVPTRGTTVQERTWIDAVVAALRTAGIESLPGYSATACE